MAELHILWINNDELTFDKMVAMYARNSKIEYWWDEVTLIIWGGTAKLTVESAIVQARVKELIHVGVKVSACKACTDQLGVTEILKGMGIEIKYWGKELTRIIQEREYLITI